MSKPSKNDIKTLGAVFTPKTIVDEMLNVLPTLKPDTRWLEPCVGEGAFVSEIVKRYPNADLTCIDIEEKFAKKCEAKTKIPVIIDDFLTREFTHKFDVIIGNPPYQKPNLKNGRARGGKSQLYLEFMDKCISLLALDGYLLFIHPSNWRKIGSKQLPFILENMTIHHITLYKKKVFHNIGVNVDWYLIQNTNNKNKNTTKIVNPNGTTENIILPTSLPFIPNELNETIITDIISIHFGKHYKCHLSCELHAYTKKHLISKSKTKEHIFPLVNTSSQPYLWSKQAHSNQYKKKVILSNSGKLNPFFDNGELGTTQNSMYILVDSKKNAKHIISLLTSNKYTRMIKICQWGLFRTEQKLIEYFGF